MEDGERKVPAFDWLMSLPLNIRTQLLATVQAVEGGGPDRWRDRRSHKAMRDNVDRVHEARDKHGQTLYRLFLRWQRDERRVVFLDGRVKDNNTQLADTEYVLIEQLADLADAEDPRSPPRMTSRWLACAVQTDPTRRRVQAKRTPSSTSGQ